MALPILATKLYVPQPRSKIVLRPHLIERLNASLPSGRTAGVTLISAPAGFGKTTLLSEWINQEPEGRRKKEESGALRVPSVFALHSSKVAWLSLDEGDDDPSRFLTYLVAALQTVAPTIGGGVLDMLQSPQPPSAESILTALLNEITNIPDNFILILDDYHVIDATRVDHALAFLLEHQPPQMHLVIATREDPPLSLARLRARGQLTELRAADLRFSLSEAADFLNQVMGLSLSAGDIAALENRTEGWIAGLQLAAISMQGQKDTDDFIQSFTGSHHFVMDYLVEEVLQRQPARVQTFLLRTSILNRMCGPLCDAVLLDSFASGQETLEYLEHANLFIVPLDNERRWYRYHHLFADLLRQRLHQSIASPAGTEAAERRVNELHIRASQWYEANDLHIEAFHHAAAANDIERVEQLIGGDRIPQHLRGAVTAILDWLESLPKTVLDNRPWLQWRYASLLLVNGYTTGVEEKLQAAEAALAEALALRGAEPDEMNRNLIGQIAAARAVLALTRYQVETMIAQSRRALEYLHPNNLISRATANWTLGYAYLFLRDHTAARRALTEAISIGHAGGDIFTTIIATIGLGNVQEAENQLYLAAETYRRILQLAGDQPLQIINEVHLGLARILYEWNDLEAAEQHAEQSLHLARQYDRVIDRFIICEVFLARLKLAQGDVAAAAAILAKADQSARQHNFVHRMPEIAAAQVLTLLHQGNLAAATHLAQTHGFPLSQARVHLAQGDPSAALTLLESFRQQVEAKGWKDEQLKTMVLQAVALHANGENDKAVQLLADALALAEPGGFIRIFIDEGIPMARLLSGASARGMMPGYIGKLLAVFETENQQSDSNSNQPSAQPLIEPLSQRELEVLQLVAQGLSNDEIGKRLFLALDTVKGHNRRIYDKLQVQRRTEAVARARELGLL
ncbi:MAG TPA: LuxR C-terminal-related transcriptional regulator [Anaerolineales bacterium]|nr:LuxR C-terminal-related transcriptional regulator [Anaerolineales bacterium]